MKLRKIISLIVTIGLIMTCAAIVSVPAAYAEMVNTSTEYSEDFESYGILNQQNTLLTLKDSGWYACDHTQLYTNVTTVAPYSTMNYKLANITDVDGSRVLRIVTAGERTDGASVDYGYGRALPGVAANGAGTGVYKIQFDFKPIAVSNKIQFYFGLNTADGSASSNAVAQHNLVSGAGTKFYTGYRNYNTLYSNNVTQGTITASDTTYAGGLVWYTVKATVDCDARYYSTEIYNRTTGKLVARRSPISFDASETVGFIKFSALGTGGAYAFYLDNIHIWANQEKETTIYNETFDSFTNASYRASAGMATGTDSTAGTSYFEGYTPWRFVSTVGNAYDLVEDATLGSQVVKLGDLGGGEASSLTYMQVGENIVTQATQPARGMVKLSFKIKPSSVSSDVTVNVIPAATYDITNNDYAFFKITDDGGTPKLVTTSGNNTLSASKWYDVELLFDVINRSVTTKVTDITTSDVITFKRKGNTTPNAVKGIMFKVDGGSTVFVDDIKLEYDRSTADMDISTVKIGDTEVTALSDITAGSTVNVTVNYANSSETGITGNVIVAFYGDSKLLDLLWLDKSVAAGTYGTDSTTFEFTVPAGLDMSKVEEVSVLLWDGFTNILPYCPAKSFQ